MTAYFTRRDLLKYSGLGLMGSSISGLLSPLAARAAEDAAATGRKPPRSCILLWMSGGPAHQETFDPKPEADQECRGEYKPISTSISGIQICEKLPRLAQQMQHMTLLRGMSHNNDNHPKGTLLMHYGREGSETVAYPTMGSIVAAQRGDPAAGMPNFLTLYGAMGAPGFSSSPGSGYLGPRHAPLVMPDPTAKLEDFVVPVSRKLLSSRLKLLKLQEEMFAKRVGSPLAAAHAEAYRQVEALLDSGKLEAFDLSRESEEMKERYGCNHSPVFHQNEPTKPQTVKFGEGCLLARRLVQAGVPFVEVVLPFWDTHEDHWFIMPDLCDIIDRSMSALISDLDERGLLDETLIVWMGEFGRTPKIGTAGPPKFRGPGRQHYAKAFSAVLAGGGIKTGQVVGATDKNGAEVTDRPIGPADLLATVCTIMGIDHRKQYDQRTGQPVDMDDPGSVANGIAISGGKPVSEVIA